MQFQATAQKKSNIDLFIENYFVYAKATAILK